MNYTIRCPFCDREAVLDDLSTRRGLALCLFCADAVDEDAFREWQEEAMAGYHDEEEDR